MLRAYVRDAGDAAVLAELPPRIDPMTNAAVLRLADRVHRAHMKGVRDIVPAIRSLAVFFDPLRTDVDELKHALANVSLEPDIVSEGRRHEVPVVYGGEAGPDAEEVASGSGISLDELVARHSRRDYRVYMLGFLPGFAYLGTLDSSIVAPRRATPRFKVPAGSVGVAGAQTGIYPRESPGGWSLIGRTPLPVFDPLAEPACRFAPGDVVRFVSVAEGTWSISPATPEAERPTPAFEVQRGGILTTVQDGGRWGHQVDGVSIAGAMDRASHRIANAIVGNESSAATIEITMTGPELRCVRDVVVAVTGADLTPTVNGQPLGMGQAIKAPAGAVIRFGTRQRGARAYLACAGGFDVPRVLGSRSTHMPSALGGVSGRALRAGDRLGVLPRGPLSGRRAQSSLDLPLGGARLRVLPGPQANLFPKGALEQLTRARFTITADANRMGYRLRGETVSSPNLEMISDVTFPGAIQVPSSGEPILLMMDRQTTGGYGQLAIVVSADMPAAAQLAPGDWVEFELTTRDAALAALTAQERMLQHLEGHAFA